MSNPPPQNERSRGYNDPAMEKYRSAWDTLHANRFVNNPSLSEDDHIYLRGIQGTWKVKQERWADRGSSCQIMLIWDQDRIWGAFDLGDYQGILMVDHGPDREPPQWSRGQKDDDSDDDDDVDGAEGDGPAADPVYFDFKWRGTFSAMPDYVFNSLVTKGKIEFGTTYIRGYFEGMLGPDDRCGFDGEALWGPRRVPRTLQSFIDDWNDLNLFGEDETVRPAPLSVTKVF